MSDLASFLAAAAASPDDDLPRLVFADWLEEHGEPERAEFIRTHCQLAGVPMCHRCKPVGCPVCPRGPLSERVAELSAAGWTRLLDPDDAAAIGENGRPQFTRGLLSGVQFRPGVPAAEVLGRWDRVCDAVARHPWFDTVECPGWFRLTIGRNDVGTWQAALRFDHPAVCPECEGNGWVPGAMDCSGCSGRGRLEGQTHLAVSRAALLGLVRRAVRTELAQSNGPPS